MKLWRPLYWPVMWSETIGHRTRPGLGLTHGGLGLDLGQLVLQIWCCVMKHALVTLIVMQCDLEGHSNISVSSTIYSFSYITTV